MKLNEAASCCLFCKDVSVMGLCWCSVEIGFINIKLSPISNLLQRQTHPKTNVPSLKSANLPCQGTEQQCKAMRIISMLMLCKTLILTFSPEIHLYIFLKSLAQIHSNSQSINTVWVVFLEERA